MGVLELELEEAEAVSGAEEAPSSGSSKLLLTTACSALDSTLPPVHFLTEMSPPWERDWVGPHQHCG